MNILVCPDSFKGTLTSIEIAELISGTLSSKGYSVKSVPVGDGGEGTVAAILYALKGEKKFVIVKDPLGREINAYYGLKNDIAYIEVAQSSGLILLSQQELNPLLASTYGFGQLIKDAIKQNVNKIYLAIGGSATNDFGIGMLQALGVRFYDVNDNEIHERINEGYGASILPLIKNIDVSDLKKSIKNIEFKVLCDVTNPLYGPEGCSRIFAPQKGANFEVVEILEKDIIEFAKVVKNKFGIDTNFPGAGAAGGLGAALKIFFNAEIINGINGVIELLKLEDLIKKTDVVIVGEGSMDYQSIFGKAPFGIALMAKKYNKKVIAINGKTDDSAAGFLGKEIDAIYSCFENNNYDIIFLKKNAIKKLNFVTEKLLVDLKTL